MMKVCALRSQCYLSLTSNHVHLGDLSEQLFLRDEFVAYKFVCLLFHESELTQSKRMGFSYLVDISYAI